MPLVRITLNASTDLAVRSQIADGIHEALVSAIGIPRGDRFQIIEERPEGSLIFDPEYLGVSRRDVVYIQVTLVAGRSTDRKLALYQLICTNLAERAHVRPEDVFIVLTENDRADWSAGNGEAQLLAQRPSKSPGRDRPVEISSPPSAISPPPSAEPRVPPR